MSPKGASARVVDPRAVRVSIGPAMAHLGAPPVVVEPGAVEPATPEADGLVLIDDIPVRLDLVRRDAIHLVLEEGRPDATTRSRIMMLPIEAPAGPATGIVRREVIVDGWRIEVEVESERRASLRERARRGHEETARAGPTEVHAIIPGRVLTVSVVPGDSIAAGQQLLVIEAMKMQNELRAPRDGVVARIEVGQGQTIEVGDLLVVLE